MKNEYKIIREQLLFEREKNLLPATQLILEKELEIEELESTKYKLTDKYNKIRKMHIEKINKFSDLDDQIPIKEAINKYNTMRHRLMNVTDLESEESKSIDTEISNLRNNKKSMKKTYILKCINETCSGMLSEESVTDHGNYKCTICKFIVCKDCRIELKDETDHECDKELLSTIEFINSTSKPCPSCGTAIYKISGCFGKNTIIPLMDGTNKFVQEVQVGDVLVGDDHNPREVLHLFTGEDQMYTIDQDDGEPYIVNSVHNLCLIKQNMQKVVITVRDYLLLTEEAQSELYGYRVHDKIKFTKITVTKAYVGTYYGFMIDGNNKFLYIDSTCLSNCNAMFCCHCHTPFDWITLKITNGPVHNPHHIEYLRQQGVNTRNPMDVPCGIRLSMTQILNVMHSFNVMTRNRGERYKKIADNIVNLFRLNIHHTQYLGRYTNVNLHTCNENLRLRLLRKDISEEKFRSEIQRVDKANSKKRSIADILITYRDCSNEIFYRMASDYRKLTLDEFMAFFDEMFNLEKYVNECFAKISVVYGSRQLMIDFA
jgi:hypothetical protein